MPERNEYLEPKLVAPLMLANMPVTILSGIIGVFLLDLVFKPHRPIDDNHNYNVAAAALAVGSVFSNIIVSFSLFCFKVSQKTPALLWILNTLGTLTMTRIQIAQAEYDPVGPRSEKAAERAWTTYKPVIGYLFFSFIVMTAYAIKKAPAAISRYRARNTAATTHPNEPFNQTPPNPDPFLLTITQEQEMAEAMLAIHMVHQYIAATPNPPIGENAEILERLHADPFQIPPRLICPLSGEIMTYPAYLQGDLPEGNEEELPRCELSWLKRVVLNTHQSPFTRKPIHDLSCLRADRPRRIECENYVKEQVTAHQRLLLDQYSQSNDVMETPIAEEALRF